MQRTAYCHCGALSATTTGEPLLVGLCHCRACQRRTGTVAGSIAGFTKAQVAVKGETIVFERPADSGRSVRFHFCPTCGTTLYSETEARPDLYLLAVGAFADPDFPPPSVSIFEEAKHPWLQLPEGIKSFQSAIGDGLAVSAVDRTLSSDR